MSQEGRVAGTGTRSSRGAYSLIERLRYQGPEPHVEFPELIYFAHAFVHDIACSLARAHTIRYDDNINCNLSERLSSHYVWSLRYCHNMFVRVREPPSEIIKVKAKGKERRKMQSQSEPQPVVISKRLIQNKKETTTKIKTISSLILQDPKLLPLATAIPHAALAAVPLAVEGVFGLLLLRGVEEEAAAAQGFSVVEEDVGFVLVHFAQNDDKGWVALRMLC